MILVCLFIPWVDEKTMSIQQKQEINKFKESIQALLYKGSYLAYLVAKTSAK